MPAIRPRPALTESELHAAEAELGFELPLLVRSLYQQVADGGYGPGWGILPLRLEKQPSIVAYDRLFRQSWDAGAPSQNWPEPFIRFCEWSCNVDSGIDCSKAACSVIRFDPARGGQDDADRLIAESDYLSEWLAAWLDGERLWERVGRPGRDQDVR